MGRQTIIKFERRRVVTDNIIYFDNVSNVRAVVWWVIIIIW